MIIINGKIKLSGIYCILNKSTGKVYIGSAVNMNARIYHHSSSLLNNEHHSILLQRAYNKYGRSDFEVLILEFVDDKSLLLVREQYWIDLNESANPSLGYNVYSTAGSRLGIKQSEETKAKISAYQTDERKAELSALYKGKKCGPRSEEIKAKIKETLIGSSISEKRREKISKGLKKYWADKRIAEFPNIIQVIN